MVAYTYSKLPTANFNTTPPSIARSATGSVYDIGDTGFTTPLNMTMVIGGAVVTTISSDALGFLPDFTLLDRVKCVWKQTGSSFATVLTTSDPIPGPPGPNTVPTQSAIQSEVTTPGTPTAAALTATYGRGSIYLKDYLTAGATAAANRTAYQAAVDAAATAGKPLCYDGARFTFAGTVVTDTSANAVHWATGWDTHKVTNQTRGRGVLRLQGVDSLVLNLNIDGANPTLDFTGVTADLTNNGAFRHSYGIALVGPAHRGVIRNVRVSGFFYGTIASAVPPEDLATADLSAATEANYPAIQDVLIDGVYSDGCWSACQPIAFRRLKVRRLTGWYQATTASGAEPHMLYASWLSTNFYSESLDVSDCSSTGGSQRAVDPAGAYKARGIRGLKFTNLTADNCPGLLDLEYVEDFEVAGLAGRNDKTTNTAAIRVKDSKRGNIEPITLESTATLTDTAILLTLANATDVKVKEPRLTFTNNVALTGMSVITAAGACTGSTITRPRVTNKGTATVARAAMVLEASGSTGSVSGALIDDPEVIGPVLAGARLALTGAKVRYSRDRLTMAGSKVSVDSAVAAASVVNLDLPTSPSRALAWHGGEMLGDAATGSAKFPSGQATAYRFGNNWSGNWAGRITEASSGGRRMFAANFGTADTDIQADVLLGSATRAGLCLRASLDSTYLTVSRANGAVKIHKMNAGTITELATVATTIPNTMFATLRAMIVGNVIVAFLNGVQVLTYTLTGGDETTYVATNHGLYGDTAGTAAWESVVVRSVT